MIKLSLLTAIKLAYACYYSILAREERTREKGLIKFLVQRGRIYWREGLIDTGS